MELEFLLKNIHFVEWGVLGATISELLFTGFEEVYKLATQAKLFIWHSVVLAKHTG